MDEPCRFYRVTINNHWGTTDNLGLRCLSTYTDQFGRLPLDRSVLSFLRKNLGLPPKFYQPPSQRRENPYSLPPGSNSPVNYKTFGPCLFLFLVIFFSQSHSPSMNHLDFPSFFFSSIFCVIYYTLRGPTWQKNDSLLTALFFISFFLNFSLLFLFYYQSIEQWKN